MQSFPVSPGKIVTALLSQLIDCIAGLLKQALSLAVNLLLPL